MVTSACGKAGKSRRGSRGRFACLVPVQHATAAAAAGHADANSRHVELAAAYDDVLAREGNALHQQESISLAVVDNRG